MISSTDVFWSQFSLTIAICFECPFSLLLKKKTKMKNNSKQMMPCDLTLPTSSPVIQSCAIVLYQPNPLQFQSSPVWDFGVQGGEQQRAIPVHPNPVRFPVPTKYNSHSTSPVSVRSSSNPVQCGVSGAWWGGPVSGGVGGEYSTKLGDLVCCGPKAWRIFDW